MIEVSEGAHAINAPISLDNNLLVLPSAGSSLTLGGNISDGGSGLSLTLNNSGTLVLRGANSYLGGTVVEDGTLIIANASALPAGTSLTVGAGGVAVFDASPSASSLSAAGLTVRAPDTAATSETSTPIVATSAPTNVLLAASNISIPSPAISAALDSPSDTPLNLATEAVMVGNTVQQAAVIAAPSSTHWGTDRSASAASAVFVKDVPSVATPTALWGLRVDAVFALHRSARDQTTLPADNAQSARPWAWPAAIESSWNSADQDKTTDAKIAALDKVLARFGV
jgi:autotransporter-associated beta strand protein